MGFERLTEQAASNIPGYRDSFADLAPDADPDSDSDSDEKTGTRGVLSELSRWFANRSGAAQF